MTVLGVLLAVVIWVSAWWIIRQQGRLEELQNDLHSADALLIVEALSNINNYLASEVANLAEAMTGVGERLAETHMLLDPLVTQYGARMDQLAHEWFDLSTRVQVNQAAKTMRLP